MLRSRAIAMLAALLAVIGVVSAPARSAAMQDSTTRIALERGFGPRSSSAPKPPLAEVPSFAELASGSPLFLQKDPYGFEDSVNLYAFARHDPINNRDPTGAGAEAALPLLGTLGTGLGLLGAIGGALLAPEVAIPALIYSIVISGAALGGGRNGYNELANDPDSPGKQIFAKPHQPSQGGGAPQGSAAQTGTPNPAESPTPPERKENDEQRRDVMKRDLTQGPHAADTPMSKVLDRAESSKWESQGRWTSPEAARRAAERATGTGKQTVRLEPGEGVIVDVLPNKGGTLIRPANKAILIPKQAGSKPVWHMYPIGPEHPDYD